MSGLKRCEWVNLSNPEYVEYHDREWGRPVRDDQKLFELLCLEGAQAGLSWETILKKRKEYLRAFENFDIQACAKLSDARLEEILKNPGVVRHRKKIFGVRQNALAALKIQKEYGSLTQYFWDYVRGEPLVNRPKNLDEVPAKTPLSEEISRDLKKRGFTFTGPTIIYAFMQAVGMVDDHTASCFMYRV